MINSFFFDIPGGPLIGSAALILSLTVSIHAILWRRDFRSAGFWVVVVWGLPILGPFLYALFGINRIHRKALRIKKQDLAATGILAREPVTTPRNILDDFKELSVLVRMLDHVVERPLLGGNKITPLFDGEQAYPSMLSAIRQARHSIGLETYIFSLDVAGKKFIEELVRAERNGVQVRVLIDDVGSGFSWKPVYKELTRHHIPVSYFNPTLVPWRFAYMNLRNHRKILTIDGHKAFTGGMNIDQNHLVEQFPESAAHDVHFLLEGPIVGQLQEDFRMDWRYSTDEILDGEKWFPPLVEKGSILARCIPDGPDENIENTKWTLLAALSQARESIRIMTPYLVPDQTLISALSIASMGGIQVDIILPSHIDMSVVQWASRASMWQLLKRGCRIWETPAPFNHAKLMVVDGAWTLFGSSNWDNRSLRLNFELNVECYAHSFAQELEKWMDQKISSAKPLTFDDIESRPLWMKFRDRTAALFSPIL